MKIKELNIKIEELKVLQRFGYHNVYYKEDYIKHKRKKINDFTYNTKKSKLIYYDYKYKHDNHFTMTFIYEAENGNYFRRVFNQFGETIELINEQTLLIYISNESLF